ncbi:hypothetical protein J1782_16855, partial [Rahnella sp. BCC 1045]|uniref:hypothetical protein n=1 Tax=Rahnella sp. BCC 1045 TaxID=2816251 RepID=UPI001C255BC8
TRSHNYKRSQNPSLANLAKPDGALSDGHFNLAKRRTFKTSLNIDYLRNPGCPALVRLVIP